MSGLQRIILIDTHLPGVVELKVDGHTNICGTNASGKTTLQRLIPVFYGEYPSRVVPATRDTFERWYLPRESSFIIYEYQRADGELCQAVLSSTGTGVTYRFVGKAFVLNDYVYEENGELRCTSIVPLGRAMKAQNVPYSFLLNTSQYRAVIQNDRTTLSRMNDGRQLVGYARQFSLCETGVHMRHIEKLAKAVHSKEGKMETIKAMVAAILEEDGVRPPSSNINAANVEEWISACQLIQGFDKIRHEYTELERSHQRLNQCEHRLSQLHQQLAIDHSVVGKTWVTIEGQLEETALKLKQQEGDWFKTRESLNQALSAARADIKNYERDLDKVEKSYADWQNKDIEKHQQSLQQLTAWQNELERQQEKYSLLTEKHQDIEASFNKRISELMEKHANEQSLYQAQKDQLLLERDDIKEQLHSASQQLKQQFHSQKAAIEQEYQAELYQLATQQAELKSMVQHAGFTDLEQQSLQEIEHQISEATHEEDGCRDGLKQLEQRLRDTKRQRNDADSVLNRAYQQRQQHQQQKIDCEALLYPGQNTLLEFLRKEKPGWEAELGKILRPELLKRNDLHPHLADEEGTAFFGLHLNLNNLELPSYAESEKSLQQRLETIDALINKDQEHIAQAEAVLKQTNEALSQLEREFSQQQSQLSSRESTRKRLTQDKEAHLRQLKQALEERRAEYRQRLEQNQHQQDKFKLQLEDALAELAEHQRDADIEHQAHWQQRLDSIGQQIQQISQTLEQSKQAVQNDKRQCELWLQQELDKRGVDIQEISQLKSSIQLLRENIRTAEQFRPLVNDYQHWLNSVYNGHKLEWQQALTQARQSAGEIKRDLEKQTAHYQQQSQALRDQQEQLDKELRFSKSQDEEIEQLIRHLKKLELPPSELPVSSGDIPQRLSEAHQLLTEQENLEGEVRTYIDHFDTLIASQATTDLSETWEHARHACTLITDQGIPKLNHRRMIVHLEQLLNVLVPQKLHGLCEQGRIFGKDLISYYHVLVDIDKHIVSQSVRITKEVEDELYLDGISDSSVQIRSRISELEFWPELKQFDKLYRQWHEQGAHQLPSPEYAFSMRRVLDIIGRSALQGGISKLLDIELRLRESNSDLVIRTDRQLNESSSHGMAYLILCKFLLAFTRLLRGPSQTVIHWPIDELGTLHQSNIKKVFDACQKNQIRVLGAFPNPESEVLHLFDNRYLIDKASKKLKIVQPRISPIVERLQARHRAEASTDSATTDSATTEENAL